MPRPKKKNGSSAKKSKYPPVSELFTIELHHGGIVKQLPKYAYLGGFVDEVINCDPDRMSMWELDKLVMQLGYDGPCGYYFRQPQEPLETGLVYIASDDFIVYMLASLPPDRTIEIYVKHSAAPLLLGSQVGDNLGEVDVDTSGVGLSVDDMNGVGGSTEVGRNAPEVTASEIDEGVNDNVVGVSTPKVIVDETNEGGNENDVDGNPEVIADNINGGVNDNDNSRQGTTVNDNAEDIGGDASSEDELVHNQDRLYDSDYPVSADEDCEPVQVGTEPTEGVINPTQTSSVPNQNINDINEQQPNLGEPHLDSTEATQDIEESTQPASNPTLASAHIDGVPVDVMPESAEVSDEPRSVDESSDEDGWPGKGKKPIKQPHYPKFSQAEMKKPTFVVGQCFSSHTEFKDTVREYAMNKGVPISWKKNEKARVRAVCNKGSCPWSIFASRMFRSDALQDTDHPRTCSSFSVMKICASQLKTYITEYMCIYDEPGTKDCHLRPSPQFPKKTSLELTKINDLKLHPGLVNCKSVPLKSMK
ncbi:hypothetical protein RJ640_006315 [Escallonia rubra]|uniref:Transposase MuDR plant domain-containing protein n=1 Tax=Escallonia rubra TaxID=112253 RepID=A0AA88RP53_9ASTE|nr:hypothetical protein RJ640_006315 [Escallonia rubra]